MWDLREIQNYPDLGIPRKSVSKKCGILGKYRNIQTLEFQGIPQSLWSSCPHQTLGPFGVHPKNPNPGALIEQELPPFPTF